MHSGARTAMIGSIVQASQARMKASVVWRMVVVIGVDISLLVPGRWGWLKRLQVGRLDASSRGKGETFDRWGAVWY
jgi:hypothetical protein